MIGRDGALSFSPRRLRGATLALAARLLSPISCPLTASTLGARRGSYAYGVVSAFGLLDGVSFGVVASLVAILVEVP